MNYWVPDPKPIGLDYNGRKADHSISMAFLGRWSPRAFTGEAIPIETLLTLFEAARWAPSAFNAQPWRFVYARRETQAFAPFLNFLSPYNQSWAQTASALVVILSKPTFLPPGKSQPVVSASASFDAGAAWANLAIQAYKLGWAAHAMTGFDSEAARRITQAPADYRLEAVVAVGKPGDAASLPPHLAERETPTTRRPLSETVFESRMY